MTDAPLTLNTDPSRPIRAGWATRLIASPRFQAWAARFPLTRRTVRREGEALFDLLAGFCHSQVLMALVRLDVPGRLMAGALSPDALAQACAVPPDRMLILLRAGTALGLLRHRRGGRYSLTRRGAALVGVPGLAQMISHHDVLYRDLTDPVAFFRGEVDTELARFWPYVFGGTMDPKVAATYSDLMADSQTLVAQDTLAAVSLSGVRFLMDVGGGSGAFLTAAGKRWPNLSLRLFDLPEVAPSAAARFDASGLGDRAEILSGSFRTQALPQGADAISLVRVLYDHDDATVLDLLRKCHAALPEAGRLIISEPMLGDPAPERAGDVYFALYTLAMQTGQARSASRIAQMCQEAGFAQAHHPKAARPFVTRCLVVNKA